MFNVDNFMGQLRAQTAPANKSFKAKEDQS